MSEGVAADSNESSANKRRKINNEEEISEPAAFSLFENINNDCKVHILSFLPAEDMNSFAICSRDCRRVRSNESLDQTRTATIVLTEFTSFIALCIKIRRNRQRFTGNTCRLKIVGLERISVYLGYIFLTPSIIANFLALEDITSFDCSLSTLTSMRLIDRYPLLYGLCGILPNLQRLDLSNVSIDEEDVRMVRSFGENCPNLTKIIWRGVRGIRQCGSSFLDVPHLTHLYIDEAELSQKTLVRRAFTRNGSPSDFTTHNPSDNSIPNLHMFMYCKNLWYLSLKGATLAVSETEKVPLPQDMLVTMVRRHPTLQWLKSDLTPDNIRILQQERPDVTFVS